MTVVRVSDLRKFWYLYRQRRNAWLKKEELLKIQEKKLGMIVEHAYNNVDYYHQRFRSCKLRPQDIRKIEDLKKLPPTARQEVRANFPKGITAKNIDLSQCTSYSTSGSTGIPLTVVVDPLGNDYRAGLFGRPFFECGLRLRDTMMFIGDSRHFPKNPYWFEKLHILRRTYFSASEPIDKQLPRISESKPDVIYSYSSYLFLLAKEAMESETNKLHPRLIFTTAEVLGDKERELIHNSTGAEIFDLYGSVETERLAWECSNHHGYHMDVDGSVIEFVKDNESVSAGEEGRVLVTCLYNYAMPLIRYDLGDVGVPSDESCSCGRGLPMMERIVGRKDDFITCVNGKVVSPIPIVNVIKSATGIKQYKVVQHSKTELSIFIVKDETFSQRTLEQVAEEVRKFVGAEMTICISVVEKIESEKSGKIRAIVSYVKEGQV